jgi:hypothetical protein
MRDEDAWPTLVGRGFHHVTIEAQEVNGTRLVAPDAIPGVPLGEVAAGRRRSKGSPGMP